MVKFIGPIWVTFLLALPLANFANEVEIRPPRNSNPKDEDPSNNDFFEANAGFSFSASALVSTLATTSVHFDFNIFREVYTWENVFFSPFALRALLSMSASGSVGQTITQINSLIGVTEFSSESEINMAFRSVINPLIYNENYIFKLASRIYVDQTIDISQTYIETLQNYYHAEVVSVDFYSNLFSIATDINTWINTATTGAITHIVDTFVTPPQFLLVNGVYYQGVWEYAFDTSLSTSGLFTLLNGQMQTVTMMQTLGNFGYYYYEYLNCEIVRLDYAHRQMAMYIFLPRTNVQIIQQQISAEVFSQIKSSLVEQLVHVSIPRFQVSFKHSFDSAFQHMGLVNIFQTSSNAVSLANSNIIHQAVVSVTESGLRQSSLDISMSHSATKFVANKSFFSIIESMEVNQILFMGQINNFNII